MTAHLISCTAVALLAVGATLLLPRQRAAYRHAILFLALVRFAVPTAWLMDAGRGLMRVIPADSRVQRTAEDLAWLLLSPGVEGGATRVPNERSKPPYAEFAWAAGLAVCLGVWARGALRKIPAVRAATAAELQSFRRVAGEFSADLRIVAEDVGPGACGWWRAFVILPDGLSGQLTEAELECVLAHEIAHLQRRDNLLAAISHAIVAVFWFHPLLWWIERRMLAERETACDELVLARGARAGDYALAILKVCRLSFAGVAGYAGVAGSNLESRMEFIMSVDLNRTSSRAAPALLVTLLTLAVMAPVASGYLHAQQPPPVARTAESAASLQRGMELMAQKKYTEAEEAFREARALDPANTRALMGQVEARTANGHRDEALKYLQAEADKNPSDRGVQLALGNSLVRAAEYDRAIAVFEKLLAQVAEDPKAAGDIYLRLGETYRRKGDVELATTRLRRALELLPENVVVRSTLALVLEAAGNREEAQREYRAVLQRDPTNAVVLNNLAFLLTEDNLNLEEALTLAQRAHELVPRPEIADTLGWVYLKMNQPDRAIALFNDEVEKKPANATFHYHLALALSQKGDKFAATEQLKTALQLNPSREIALKIELLLEEIKQ